MNTTNISAGLSDQRMKLRGMLTALGAAVTVTVTVTFPEVNPTIVAAWGSFYMLAVQYGESYYDNKGTGG